MKISIYNSLLKWKESTNRKPLVLEGILNNGVRSWH